MEDDVNAAVFSLDREEREVDAGSPVHTRVLIDEEGNTAISFEED